MRRLTLILMPLLVATLSCSDSSSPEPEESPLYSEIASESIGTDGGEIVADELTLSVPQSAFDEPSVITISSSTRDRPFGADHVSKSYRIEGIPVDHREPIQIAIEHPPGAEECFISLGEEAFAPSSGEVRLRHRFIPTVQSDGVARGELPVPDSNRVGTSRSTGGETYVKGASPVLSVFIISGWTAFETDEGHFLIYMPLSSTQNHNELGDYLEEAYRIFLNPNDLNFSYDVRTNWPLTVMVMPLNDDGGANRAYKGVNYGWIDLNVNLLNNLPELRTTCGHEFFHVVQSFYDPRNMVSAACCESQHYWVDEATAVWSETNFTDIPDFTSPARNPYQLAPFAGMQKGAELDEPRELCGADAQQHGYGMSAVIAYLVSRYGMTILPSIYQAIEAGEHPVDAVCRHDPSEWWTDFLVDYMLGNIYNDVSRTTWRIYAAESCAIATESDIQHEFSDEYADLSGNFYNVELSYPGFEPDDELVFTLSGASKRHLTLFRYSRSAFEQLASGASSVVVNDLQSLVAGGWNLMALVTNNRYENPYTTMRNITLEIGVPESPDPFGATRCVVVLDEVDVVYRLPDGSTENSTLRWVPWEVDSGGWNGNTFEGTYSLGNIHNELRVTVDRTTLAVTYFFGKRWDSYYGYEYVVEGDFPNPPDPDATESCVCYAAYVARGSSVCSMISSLSFSNRDDWEIVNRSCNSETELRIVFDNSIHPIGRK